MVGLTALHQSSAVCKAEFFEHICHMHPYYMADGGGHAILVDLNFQRAHYIQHVELVSGSSHCLTWFRDAM